METWVDAVLALGWATVVLTWGAVAWGVVFLLSGSHPNGDGTAAGRERRHNLPGRRASDRRG